MQVYEQITQRGHQFQLATPNGTVPELQCAAENVHWVKQNKQLLDNPLSLDACSPDQFDALCFPCGMGALEDLHKHQGLGKIIHHFFTNSSMHLLN
jgi:putative intracellular protease/amidase